MDLYKKLYDAAAEYVSAEAHPWFKGQVIEALNQEAVQDLNDRFYRSLSFGTAGMRGVIGGGTNRMNPYIVSKVTQGLAAYILKTFPAGDRIASQDKPVTEPLVVIAFDSRNYSDVFADAAACVLCANGIKVELFETLHPVPMLSFAVRNRKAYAGIVITASHNPAEYNGYKVYWSDGGQVTPPHDTGIVAEVERVSGVSGIKRIEKAEAVAQGLLTILRDDADADYYEMVLSHLVRPELFSTASPIKVVYTPLHGAGNIPVQTLFKRLGVDYRVVGEQEHPNGNFPTVPMPNPEDPEAMKLAIALAKKEKADLVLGTDPDSDRLGIAFPTDPSCQEYMLLTGNQIAVLLCDYLLSAWRAKNPEGNGFCVKSLVTTDLMKEVAASYGVPCRDVLTGFKYIAEQIASAENTPEVFLFGAEESFGYLAVPQVRDKDAVSSALFAVEMMLYLSSKGLSLIDRLYEIWSEFGYYEEKVVSRKFEGESGMIAMAAIMKDLREHPPVEIGDVKVASFLDLKNPGTGFPDADVLIIQLDNGEKVVIRPSGTEPKIKYYLYCNGKQVLTSPSSDSKADVVKQKEFVAERITELDKQVSLLLSK